MKPLCYCIAYLDNNNKLKTVDNMRILHTLKEAKTLASEINKIINKKGFFVAAKCYFNYKGKRVKV